PRDARAPRFGYNRRVGRLAALALLAACDASIVQAPAMVDASVGPSHPDAPPPPPIDAPPAPDAGTSVVTFSTTFDGTESPISESGAWTHVGQDWTLVDTGGGIAYGTQTGTGGYNDSYAHLSGFPPDHTASAVVFRSSSLDGVCGTHEVEVLLRWSDAAHDAHGYECNLAFDGSYAQIVRWNGPFGDFTYLGQGSVPGGVKTGDVLSAKIVGAHITLYVNGAEVANATDANPFPTGNPGI